MRFSFIHVGLDRYKNTMGAVRVINDDGQFYGEMASAGAKLVVVDFTATW